METLTAAELAAIEREPHAATEIIPTAALQAQCGLPFFVTRRAQVEPLVPRRLLFGHKGSYGHALLIAGQRGMAGASLLAARAALRCGVGLLTLHLPRCNRPIVQTALPEVMVQIDEEEDRFATPPDRLERYSAVAVGPGLGTAPQTAEALRTLLTQATQPIVADADALNLLAADRTLLSALPRGSIVTPHPGEFERLAGATGSAAERLRRAAELAARHHIFVVLKGHFTVVVTPQGECHFNTTGNGGMATAGCGDLLTGVLLALSAQGMAPLDACRLGVYLHGLAGDLAAEERGCIGLMAGDIAEQLTQAWRRLGDKIKEL